CTPRAEVDRPTCPKRRLSIRSGFLAHAAGPACGITALLSQSQACTATGLPLFGALAPSRKAPSRQNSDPNHVDVQDLRLMPRRDHKFEVVFPDRPGGDFDLGATRHPISDSCRLSVELRQRHEDFCSLGERLFRLDVFRELPARAILARG